jgi:hypothetical protein
MARLGYETAGEQIRHALPRNKESTALRKVELEEIKLSKHGIHLEARQSGSERTQ